MTNNNKEVKEEPSVIITWSDRKTTKYRVSEMNALRKSAGGTGWLYFRPDKPPNGAYERPSAMQFIDPSRLPPSKQQQRRRLGE